MVTAFAVQHHDERKRSSDLVARRPSDGVADLPPASLRIEGARSGRAGPRKAEGGCGNRARAIDAVQLLLAWKHPVRNEFEPDRPPCN